MISLLMTVHNRESFLALALDSILCQTFQDFELIVWDDGSTDHSLDIAKEYAAKDLRIKVIAAEHKGRVQALKLAHNASSGEYIGWVDSDDLLATTTLKETSDILDANPQIGLVYTDYMVIDANGENKGLGFRCTVPFSKNQLLVDFMTFHFRLFRRSAYDRVGGFDDLLPCSPDYDLCLRLSETTKVFHLRKPLYYYRVHKDSISAQHRQQQINASLHCVRQALIRRGLDRRYEIGEEGGRFHLSRKI